MISNKRKYIPRIVLLSFMSCAVLSCSSSKKIAEKDKAKNYKLIFKEEFKGNAYNTNYWTSYDVKDGKAPWSRFVMDDTNLAEVKNGNLHVKARWNTETELPETGAIQTKNKFSFKYGKIEVRAKFNSAGQGGWPAIWLMPQNSIYEGWPNGGEMDIMERLNTDNFVHQVVHQSDGNAKHISSGITKAISPHEYNTYSVIKSPNRIEFYVNNELTSVHESKDDFAKRWPFETDYYLILNHACADKGKSGITFWPGYVTTTENFPYEMAVDYVKVWELRK